MGCWFVLNEDRMLQIAAYLGQVSHEICVLQISCLLHITKRDSFTVSLHSHNIAGDYSGRLSTECLAAYPESTADEASINVYFDQPIIKAVTAAN